MPHRVRPSLIAGQWYPGSATELQQTIEGYFARVERSDLPGEPVALVSPHAGYAYSGQTAAYAYSQVRGKSYDAVAVISPLHRVPLGRFAVTDADAYATPLGEVSVDHDLVDSLGERVPINRVGYDGEHSLEIQLPFLQVALGRFRLLPVMVGASSFDAGRQLGEALAQLLDKKSALLVASTDLHHIDNYQQVVRRDQVVVDAVGSFELDQVREALSPRDCTVCGRIPVYAVLTAAKALGASGAKVLYHTNSGDVTGVRSPGQYTVGYMAAAIYRSP
ncbi:MAG TPA: AmmeMemoRadiSam system protein B [Anaerolineae bacterium]|nr:AmmeMemoRadiSam system protein B [Anaerolineae bacterium]